MRVKRLTLRQPDDEAVVAMMVPLGTAHPAFDTGAPEERADQNDKSSARKACRPPPQRC